jgi:hypothetical protein
LEVEAESHRHVNFPGSPLRMSALSNETSWHGLNYEFGFFNYVDGICHESEG